jgi:hypothetical protein
MTCGRQNQSREAMEDIAPEDARRLFQAEQQASTISS